MTIDHLTDNARRCDPTEPFFVYFLQSANNITANVGNQPPVPHAAEIADKLAQVAQTDKSVTSTPEYYRHSPELTDTLGEQDRNSNFLHQV